ncbi:choice-of-anchor G family protein [Microbacterium sorbitolivorans]|uniref:choice-of-anchor G family protein n=1 Tax=Microbacterium sorbitolivorans TaxID=1867410 RepID=UPI001668AC94|nr:choice-of-anchor G family protein [Microbacterium sorbitolivorans]
MAANAAPDDVAEAEGRFLTFDGDLAAVVNGLAEVAPAYSATPGAPGANSRSLDLELLSALDISLGDGIQLFGENPVLGLGAVGQYANTTDASAYASSGLLGEEGAIAPATGTDPAENAYLDLAPILGAAGLDALLDQARLELGAISASATVDADNAPSGDYQIAGGTLILQSPAIGDLSAALLASLDQISGPINDLAGAGGVIDTTIDPLLDGVTTALNTVLLGVGSVDDLGVTATVDVDLAAALDSVLAQPLTSEDSVLTIDLSAGTVSVDIAKLVADTQGGDYDGTLNGLDANTELLDPDLVQAALDGAIGSTLDQIPALLVTAVTDALNSTAVNIAITGEINGLFGAVSIGQLDVRLAGTLGDFIGAAGSSTPTVDTSGTTLVGLPVGTLLEPVLQAVTNTILPALVTPLSNAITDAGALDTIFRPIVQAANDVLDPLFGLVTNNLLSLTANVQEYGGDFTSEQATNTEDTFTERALELTLLPNAPILQLALGSATVRGDFDAVVYDTSITVDPSSVEAGETTTITGDGFAPGETVTIEIDGETVATDVVVGDDGTFSYDYTVPAGTAANSYSVIATGDESNVPAEGSLTVTETAGTDSDTDSSATADVNANASASAAASANADDNSNGSAEVAAQAAAFADATSEASAAADADATAAAESAATADASTSASADATTETNAAAQASATAAAQADNTSDTNASASTAADATATADANASSAAAAQAASTADSSSEASATAAADVNADADADVNAAVDADVDTNANASASASASANADDDSNAAAQVAAQAAAQADASTTATAAANADASAAAESAANTDASTTASADATTETNAAAQTAAQAAAQTDATSTSNADASSAAEANAAAAASSASNADSSSTASSTAAADVNGDADAAATDSDSATTADTNSDADAASESETDSDSASDSDDDSSAAASANATASTAADTNSDADAAATDSDSATTADTNSDADAASESETDSDSASASDSATSSDSDSASDSDTASDSDDNSSASANASSSSTADASASSNSSSNASASANANASADADAKSLSIDIEQPRLQVGEKQTVHGHGFDAGEKVTAVQHSTPYSIGSGVADENGDVTFTWNVPASSELGNHSVELTGATSGSISATFEVYEKKKGDLSPTGGDMALPLGGAAALLMIAGAGVWFATSRRRSNS